MKPAYQIYKMILRCTALILTLAFIFAASSHQARPQLSPDLLAFLAQGGSLSDLCNQEGGAHEHECELCRLDNHDIEIASLQQANLYLSKITPALRAFKSNFLARTTWPLSLPRGPPLFYS